MNQSSSLPPFVSNEVHGHSALNPIPSCCYDGMPHQAAAIIRRRLRLGTLLDILCGPEESNAPVDSMLTPLFTNTGNNVEKWLNSTLPGGLDGHVLESCTPSSMSSKQPADSYVWDNFAASSDGLVDYSRSFNGPQSAVSQPTVDPSSFDFQCDQFLNGYQSLGNDAVETHADSLPMSYPANERHLVQDVPQWSHSDLCLTDVQPQMWDELDRDEFWSIVDSSTQASSCAVTRASSPVPTLSEPASTSTLADALNFCRPEASSSHLAFPQRHYPPSDSPLSISRSSSVFSSSTPPMSRCPSIEPSATSSSTGGKVCSHCKATSTPLWRRNSTTLEALCNACGLYLQQRSQLRPQALIDADTVDDGLTKDGNYESLQDITGPQCSHCCARQTSVWRRSKEGKQVCNACGVYARLKGKDRPLSLKRNRIKPRSRRMRKP